MTVGGVGDVFSGLTPTLYRKMNSFHASILEIYFVEQSASIVYKSVGLRMIATDVIDKLPEAMKTI